MSKNLVRTEGIACYGRESFLSNFYLCSFRDGGNTFNTVEKYYHYKKAVYFKDETVAQQILMSKTPAKALALGYQIKDYNEDMWKIVAKQSMYNGCAMKFGQNSSLADQF